MLLIFSFFFQKEPKAKKEVIPKPPVCRQLDVSYPFIYRPRREKTCLWGFWSGHTKTACSATETSQNSEILLVASFDILYFSIRERHGR